MKKIFIFFFAFLLAGGVMAQDPAKDMKKAARLLGTYNLDHAAGADELKDAIALANASISDPAVKIDPTAWQTFGEVFMAAVDNDVRTIVVNSEAPIAEPTAAAKAFLGFKMAAQLAEKSYQAKDAMKALSAGIQNIYYLGSALYQAGDYKNAYEAFKATFDAYSLLQKNNEPTTFSPEEHPKSLYYSGLCAQQAGLNSEAQMVYQQLIDAGSDEPGVYEALFNMYLKDNPEEAEKVLTTARQRFPEDVAILYAEINYLLSKGELDNLISKLERALEIEPNNVSVYVTLGQVHDSKFQRYLDIIKTSFDSIAVYEKRLKVAKNKVPLQDSIKFYQSMVQSNMIKADQSFEKAKSYYQQSLAKDSSNFDAIYSIAALWYNKAASQSLELNALSNDFSPEGNRKYDAKKLQMDMSFAESLPYFLKAKTLKPEDENTKIALREIDVRFADDDPASRVYITGPRGGCYYVRANGVKVYVDRSVCN